MFKVHTLTHTHTTHLMCRKRQKARLAEKKPSRDQSTHFITSHPHFDLRQYVNVYVWAFASFFFFLSFRYCMNISTLVCLFACHIIDNIVCMLHWTCVPSNNWMLFINFFLSYFFYFLIRYLFRPFSRCLSSSFIVRFLLVLLCLIASVAPIERCLGVTPHAIDVYTIRFLVFLFFWFGVFARFMFLGWHRHNLNFMGAALNVCRLTYLVQNVVWIVFIQRFQFILYLHRRVDPFQPIYPIWMGMGIPTQTFNSQLVPAFESRFHSLTRSHFLI